MATNGKTDITQMTQSEIEDFLKQRKIQLATATAAKL
jgi:hypothetical protein